MDHFLKSTAIGHNRKSRRQIVFDWNGPGGGRLFKLRARFLNRDTGVERLFVKSYLASLERA